MLQNVKFVLLLAEELHEFAGCCHILLVSIVAVTTCIWWPFDSHMWLFAVEAAMCIWTLLHVIQNCRPTQICSIKQPKLAFKFLQWFPDLLRLYFQIYFADLPKRPFCAFMFALLSVFNNSAPSFPVRSV